MLSPGHLHHSPANFLQLDFGGVEGKGSKRRRNGKGVRDQGMGPDQVWRKIDVLDL